MTTSPTMWWLAPAVISLMAVSAAVAPPDDPISRPTCKELSVSLLSEVPRVKVGDRPQFTVAVSNKTNTTLRILDVRDGRRPDLQDNYFELFVTKHGRLLDLPIAISDPGPVSPADFLELRPGAEVTFVRIGYKRALEELRPGVYEAFILFWRDPMESHTTGCRSTSARFTVE